MSLIERAKNIIISPKTEWDVIAAETPDVGSLLTGYALPLAVASAIASFIGYAFIAAFLRTLLGIGLGMGFGIGFGIMHAVISLIVTVASVFICAFVVDQLAPSFGSERNLGRAMQLVVYSYTPGWVGGLFAVVPIIGWLGSLFGLYGIYLMYLGLPATMKTPQDKVVVYMIVSAVILIVASWILSAVLTLILTPILGLSVLF